MPSARFDDLSAAGAATVLSGPRGVLEARAAGEVRDVLVAVDQACAQGLWAAGFLTYEAAAGLDAGLATRAPLPGEPFAELPLAWFALFDEAAPAPALAPAAAGAPGDARPYAVSPWQLEPDAEAHARAVASIRARIAAGDTYQCNLTGRMRAHVTGDLFECYRDLALAQRGAFNAFVDTGRYVVASASPELFFEWSGDQLTARPMKGTTRRGRWPAEDAERSAGLLCSAKDRAENLMIVDLVRNDLGRIATWGSVEVPSLFDLERYETLWQLTSTVTARTRPGVTLVDVLEALFPSGSITGAPKRRTMELIAMLEASRRGVYCGAVGLVAPHGERLRARFNVAIRTVVVDRSDASAVYGSGGGITWGSDAKAEHDELVAKAALLGAPRGDFQLVETMAFHPGLGLRNRRRHLARLAASASYFGFALDPDHLQASIEAALEGAGSPCRVRLVLSRAGDVAVACAPLPAASSRPVALAVDAVPVSSAEIWLHHKTTRRAVYEQRAARHRYADDVVIVNERGELTETTIANLALQLGGRWWTPPLGSGCLPGVERARLVELGRLGERVLTLDELAAAEDVAVLSSLRGWRSARLAGPAARGALGDGR